MGFHAILFMSLLFFRIAVSAPATLSSGSGKPLTLDTSSQSPNPSLTDLLPVANLTGGADGGCASSSRFLSWKTKSWQIEDCYAAVHNMFISEVLTHPNEDFEFVDRGAPATKPTLTTQRTPRKYVVGSCVLTIMMLDSFYPGELPNGRVFPRQKTDTSTYGKVYSAAKALETQCTEIRTPGWTMIGDKSAMGVFVWAKNSDIDEETGGFPVLTFPPSLNVSTA